MLDTLLTEYDAANTAAAQQRDDALRAELARRAFLGYVNRRSLNYRPLRAEVLNYLLRRGGICCSWCGESFLIDFDAMCDPYNAEEDAGLGEKVAIDHVQPITKGGAEWDLANLQILHLSCNIRKGNRW